MINARTHRRTYETKAITRAHTHTDTYIPAAAEHKCRKQCWMLQNARMLDSPLACIREIINAGTEENATATETECATGVVIYSQRHPHRLSLPRPI